MKHKYTILGLFFVLNVLLAFSTPKVNDVFAPPTILTLTPADDATAVSFRDNLSITFSENIILGTGNITIYNASDDSVFEVIDVTSNCITVVDATATINPLTDYVKGNSYYVLIDANAFENATAESFGGINDVTTWNFTTASNTAPLFTSSPQTTIDEDDVNYAYTIIASDADSDVIDINPTTLPSWLSYNLSATTVAVAGSTNGFADGNGTAAQFNFPRGIVFDKNGDLFITDTGNNRIRKMTPDFEVTTFVGDGSIADFNQPNDIVFDSAGNLYVTDFANHRIQKVTPDGTMSTLAGSGVQGYNDGNGTTAQFSFPASITIDSQDNIYIGEGFQGHRIRKITPSGDVTTLAGSVSGTSGFADATGTAALFNNPISLEVDDATGDIFVADFGNHRIRRVTQTGEVTTFSGTGVSGFNNGTATEAQFSSPRTLTKDVFGNLYLSENFGRIRRIESNGDVSTYVESTGFVAQGLVFDASGTLFLADNLTNSKINTSTIDSRTLTGTVTGQEGNHDVVLNVMDAFGGSTNQSFTIAVTVTRPTVTTFLPADDATSVSINSTFQITFSEDILVSGGDIFIYDASNDALIETIEGENDLTFNNNVASFTPSQLRKGNSYYVQIPSDVFRDFSNNDFLGFTDETTWNFSMEPNTTPEFTSTPVTTAAVDDQYDYIITVNDADGDPLTISAPTLPSWLTLVSAGVTTIAGSSTSGNTDANGTSASFNSPSDIVEDSNGNLFIADRSNFLIRRLAPNGDVTTFAGSTQGDADGTGTAAQFQFINGIAIDQNDNLYVTTSQSSFPFPTTTHRIRKITPAGVVTTLAGAGAGFADGTGANALFSVPQGIVADDAGNLYVADQWNDRIRIVTPTGDVSTLAGNGNSDFQDGNGTNAEFDDPTDITIDSAGNLFVADTNNNRIRRITPSGDVTTFAGSGDFGNLDGIGTNAQFGNLRGITIDANDNLYVYSNNGIRKITPAAEVTILVNNASGFMDGNLQEAQFSSTGRLLIDNFGNIIIADTGNNSIRRLIPNSLITGTPTATDIGTHPVVLNVADDLGANQDQSFSIFIQTLGTTNFEDINSINVYPNPSKNSIQIDVRDTSEVDIACFDLTGKIVLSLKGYKANQPIDISELQNGMYIVKVFNETLNASFRFVKQ